MFDGSVDVASPRSKSSTGIRSPDQLDILVCRRSDDDKTPDETAASALTTDRRRSQPEDSVPSTGATASDTELEFAGVGMKPESPVVGASFTWYC